MKMSLQWTLVAVFLYSEIAIVIILLLPFISPLRWHRFFKSRICQSIANQANLYFLVFIGILVLFFLDSIREMRKYTATKEQAHTEGHSHLEAEIQVSMKLFRSQRNFYIAGFALFLWLVIRRLVTLISAQANVIACCEASMKQAQSATERAERLMKENERRELVTTSKKESADNEGNLQLEEQEKEICNLKEELKNTKDELKLAKVDLDAIREQSKGLSREYDRLLEEYNETQSQLEQLTGIKEDKKEN
ncbi:B-cell receptor-associated protein 31-like [Centruroides vittatus]|uniref:B-cell receptor-associated protein 31-like n=1 Tax=Centruroides vittatus TaxID=120091 RepID=UPI00350EEF77